MPIKQVVCSICKETVNKAQTYHVGGTDRACKKHEGVTEKKDQLAKEKIEKAKQTLLDEKRRLDHFYGSIHRDEQPMKFGPKCWICMNEGLRQDEFFTRVLIEREKADKVFGGPINPFDSNHPGNKLNIGRCIFVLEKEKCANALKYIREDFEMLVQMTNIVAICGPCCGTLKINPLREVGYEELVNFAAAYEVFVKPVISEIAGAELARDN